MESELFYQVDKLLDDEANKIVKVLLELYEKKTIVNKSMSKLVRELVDNKLKYYAIEIELRVRCLLPYEYYEDCSEKYSLMNRSEYSKIHIEKYSRYCMKNERKNHLLAAQKLSDILINLYNNKSNEKGLLEIVSDYIKDLLPEHNDSVDAMAIIIYLQSEIRKRGYEIKSVEPFIMSEITK